MLSRSFKPFSHSLSFFPLLSFLSFFYLVLFFRSFAFFVVLVPIHVAAWICIFLFLLRRLFSRPLLAIYPVGRNEMKCRLSASVNAPLWGNHDAAGCSCGCRAPNLGDKRALCFRYFSALFSCDALVMLHTLALL